MDKKIKIMDIEDAVKSRRSIRKYSDKEIPHEIKKELNDLIDRCNEEGGLKMKLVCDEPKAFQSRIARYGRFRNVKNYIAVVGKRDKETEERCGYYGEQVVLYAQQLGLNTCWVGLTYHRIKGIHDVEEGDRLYCLIAIGYGKEAGKVHRNKPLSSLCYIDENSEEWFKEGVRYALMAPTAANQQRFYLAQAEEGKVRITKGLGLYSRLDVGIVKYHFELGAGKENFEWME